MSKIENKINVLLIMDHLGYDGKQIHGVGKYFLNLVPNLSKDFNVITCILRKKDGLDKHFRERGINVLYLNKQKFDPRQLLDLIKIIRKEKIHLLHLQGFGSCTFGRIAGLITRVPAIVHQRDADPKYPRYMIIADWLLSRFTAQGLAVSDYTKKFLSKTRKVPLDKILTLINPVDIERLRSIDQGKIEKVKSIIKYDPNLFYVGAITRFYPIKGVEIFIDAIPHIIKRHNDVIFVICGDGPLLIDMKEKAMELGIAGHIIFPGFVESPELWLSLFDIVVITSYSEGCPNAALEAMALKKAIVCTKCGGPEEFLDHDYSAIMINPGDEESAAEAVLKLLHDHDLRKTISLGAGKSAENYRLDKYVEKIERIYWQLLDRGER